MKIEKKETTKYILEDIKDLEKLKEDLLKLNIILDYDSIKFKLKMYNRLNFDLEMCEKNNKEFTDIRDGFEEIIKIVEKTTGLHLVEW